MQTSFRGVWTVCFICMSGTAQMLLPCHISANYIVADNTEQSKILGLVRELNPGPLAPEARIIPLDQQASLLHNVMPFCGNACLVGYALKMLAKLPEVVHMLFQRLLSIFRKSPSLPPGIELTTLCMWGQNATTRPRQHPPTW